MICSDSFGCVGLETVLLLSALLANEVCCAKAEQHGHAAAEGTALVARFAVAGGQHWTVVVAVVAVFARFRTFLEHAAIVVAALGEGAQAKAEEDSKSYDLFFHCI